MMREGSGIVSAAEVWWSVFSPAPLESEQPHKYPQLVVQETPETILLRKETLNSLSEEAKQLVELILASPGEVMEIYWLFGGKRFSPKRLARIVTGCTTKEAADIVKEIRSCLRS